MMISAIYCGPGIPLLIEENRGHSYKLNAIFDKAIAKNDL